MNEAYIRRINKVLEFIDNNLSGDLSLDAVSKIACYSPYHLHRLFRAMTNEPLNTYIIRKRAERSGIELIHNVELPISEIAYRYGFKSNASFSRTFRKIYGESPTQFRRSNKNNLSKIGKEESKNGKKNFVTEEYLRNIEKLKNWMMKNAKIEVRNLPERNLIYITQIGEEGIMEAFQKIISWARSRGILQKENSQVCRLFHDSFKITDANKVRMSIGVLVDEPISVSGEVSLSKVKGGRYIVGRFRITIEEFEQAWNGLFVWMHEKGYKKAGGNPFEMYYNDYREDPEGKCDVELCIPVA